jgi:hypothetical protein
MFERQKAEPEAPPCPICASPTVLKQVHRQQPVDHFIFKCGGCALEYPVVAQQRD